MKVYLFLILIIILLILLWWWFSKKCEVVIFSDEEINKMENEKNKKLVEGFNSTPPFTSTGGFTSNTSLEEIEKTLRLIDQDLKLTGETFQAPTTNTATNTTTNTTTNTATNTATNATPTTQIQTKVLEKNDYVDREPSRVNVERPSESPQPKPEPEPKPEEKKCPPRINVIQVPVDLSKYVLKTSIKPQTGPDMSKYILKTEIPKCNRVDPNKYILKSKIPSCMPLPIEEPEPIKKMTDIKDTILRFVKSPDNPMSIDNCRFDNKYTNLDNRPNIKFNRNPTNVYTPSSRAVDTY